MRRLRHTWAWVDQLPYYWFLFDQGSRRLSHVPVKPALHLPCSQTPDESLHLPCRALDAVPAEATTKTPSL
ncbi:MAG: hypothetical protein EOM90_02335 [Alphaproteobacteria bacterium]|nr:hypothetical protein [Alphaproteobacteria bacterium]